MPETTVTATDTNNVLTSTGTTVPVLRFCPYCGIKLIDTILTDKVGNSISGGRCSKCEYIYKPTFKSGSK